jgi:hypothetical protein
VPVVIPGTGKNCLDYPAGLQPAKDTITVVWAFPQDDFDEILGAIISNN